MKIYIINIIVHKILLLQAKKFFIFIPKIGITMKDVMKNTICLFLFIPLFCLSQNVYAQQTGSSLSLEALNREIEKLKVDVDLKHASWSICVKKVKSAEIVTEYNINQSLIPASTMKAVTTAVALTLLGSNYEFKTSLEYDGYIDSFGVLHGNLFIKGGGDPTIGSTRFNSEYIIDSVYSQFLQAITKFNIQQISGSVIADAQIFTDDLIPYSYMWVDMGNYYAAGSCGLSINENLYRVIFEPGNKIGSHAKVLRTEPIIQDIEFINYVETGKAGSGDQVIIYGSPYSNVRILKGTVPYGKKEFAVKGSMPDPAYFFAHHFNNFLTDNGVEVANASTTVRKLKLDCNFIDTTRTSIYTHLSPPLSLIVRKTNMGSINTYAETLLNILGSKFGKEGSTKGGIGVVKSFWTNKDLDLKGFTMKDGSGLSRMNYVSTDLLTEMLLVMTKQKAYESFLESLPEAGKSGTMMGYCKGTFAQNNLKAKTGTMSGIKSYAGYVTNKNKEELVFAIIVNNYSGYSSKMKKKLEKLMVLISETD